MNAMPQVLPDFISFSWQPWKLVLSSVSGQDIMSLALILTEGKLLAQGHRANEEQNLNLGLPNFQALVHSLPHEVGLVQFRHIRQGRAPWLSQTLGPRVQPQTSLGKVPQGVGSNG